LFESLDPLFNSTLRNNTTPLDITSARELWAEKALLAVQALGQLPIPSLDYDGTDWFSSIRLVYKGLDFLNETLIDQIWRMESQILLRMTFGSYVSITVQ
jgi:hypothetical protein